MKLHSLPKSKKAPQRIGRGGKRGHTAGRGTKGQKSRSGRRLRPAERDLILRIPKMRGYQNKAKSDKATIFSLETLSNNLKSHTKAGTPLEIDIAFLKTAGLLAKSFSGTVKILSDGEIAFPVSIKGIAVSKSTKEKVEKAGGKIFSDK
jgi:large subunit ribosomal protein L15